VIERASIELLSRISIVQEKINLTKHTIFLSFMPMFYVTLSASRNKFIRQTNVSLIGRFRVLQFPIEGWLRIALNHGSITQMTILSDGSVVMKSIGDSGFMPSSKITF
jgi:hypothetical protein